MVRNRSALAALLALVMVMSLVLAACGDSGDEGDDPTATSAGVESQATATTRPASPTAAATQTPRSTTGGTDAEPGTATVATTPSVRPGTPTPTRDTSKPVATTPTDPVPTATEEGESELTDLEQTLMDTLLEESDLPEGFVLDSAVVPEPDTDEDDEICGASPFPRREEKLAEVEAEYSNETAGVFILQSLTVFPEDVAIEAMDFAREATSCTEWTDPEGTTITVTPLPDYPAVGDDSFAQTISFDAGDGQIVNGEWVFLRVGEIVGIVAYLGLNDADLSALPPVVERAAERMAEAQGGSTSVVDDLLVDSLLTTEEIGTEWTETYRGPLDDEAPFPVCNGSWFSEDFAPVSGAEGQFEVNEETGPFVFQSISIMEEGTVAEVMDSIRATSACGEWTEDDGSTYQITEIADVALGDATAAYLISFEAGELGPSEVVIFYTAVSDAISALMYAQIGGVDSTFAGELAATAAAKLATSMSP